jgi:hypothetical protein
MHMHLCHRICTYISYMLGAQVSRARMYILTLTLLPDEAPEGRTSPLSSDAVQIVLKTSTYCTYVGIRRYTSACVSIRPLKYTYAA